MNRLTWSCRTLSLAGKETQERVEAGLREQGVEAILAWSTHLDGSYCVSVAKRSDAEDSGSALEDNRSEEGGDSCHP